MNIFSKIVKQQCLKEYEKELLNQQLSLEQWMASQPAFVMKETYADAAILYGDYMEKEPIFLPDFSPNRWDYEDYLGEAVYIRKEFYDQIDWNKVSRRSGLKQVMAAAESKGYVPVMHIRSMLKGDIAGFVRLEKLPSKGNYQLVQEEVLQEAVSKGISIVIPSKDNPVILKKCVQSIEKTTEVPLEIIIVDNGSCKEHKVLVEAMCKFTTEGTDNRLRCQYIYEPMTFNFSKMCNIGAEKASGEYVLFLNDDIEATENGWLTELLIQAVKPYTGAVGMKLLYPDASRIQHAGIVNLPMGPVHKLQYGADKEVYYNNRNRGVHNVCAVTGACLMMRKQVFFELGGMCEELPVAFNDVELCFHAMEQGYYNVVCCNTFLLHHESISRGQDNTEEKRGRLLRERGKLYELHPKQTSFDPFYPYTVETGYGLGYAYLDTAIRPAYEDGAIAIQKVEKVIAVQKAKEHTVFAQKAEHEKLNHCLKVEIEQLYQEKPESIYVAGYSFVIGSDNAQFMYTLVLRGEDTLYGIALNPVRRSDLERNIPDQIHVGLAGFYVEIPVNKLKKGRYHVEIYAKDRASSLRLKQSSNVYMQIN